MDNTVAENHSHFQSQARLQWSDTTSRSGKGRTLSPAAPGRRQLRAEQALSRPRAATRAAMVPQAAPLPLPQPRAGGARQGGENAPLPLAGVRTAPPFERVLGRLRRGASLRAGEASPGTGQLQEDGGSRGKASFLRRRALLCSAWLQKHAFS